MGSFSSSFLQGTCINSLFRCSSCSWIRTNLGERGILFLSKVACLVLEHPYYVSARAGTVKTFLEPKFAEVQQFRNNSKTAPKVNWCCFCKAGAHAQAALGDCEWKLQRSGKKQSVEISNDNVQLTLMGTRFLKKHHSGKISPCGHLGFLRGCSGYLCASPKFCCPCYRQLQMCAQTLQWDIVHPTTVSSKIAGWQLFWQISSK